RQPEALDDLATGAAEVDGKAHEVGVAEGVVGGDGSDARPALLIDDIAAEAITPLQAIGIVAEVVWRRLYIGCFQGARGSIDNGLVRNCLGVVAQGHALRAR